MRLVYGSIIATVISITIAIVVIKLLTLQSERGASIYAL